MIVEPEVARLDRGLERTEARRHLFPHRGELLRNFGLEGPQIGLDAHDLVLERIEAPVHRAEQPPDVFQRGALFAHQTLPF